ncbi:MAG TPA: ATP-binding protein [Ruminococcus flavefaciens]|nr:ATP-binding protein [Ruminococcus flavefaciens]
MIVLEADEMHNVPHYEDLCQYESGTLIVWQELDRLKSGEINFEEVLGKKIDGVRDHIALVFHRYLSGEAGLKKIKININNSAIAPFDPFLSGKSQQPMDDEILIIRGEKITVRPYILPHTSKMTADEIKRLGGKDGLRKQQGFYIYRNKRLLVWGTWFRMMRKGDLSKLARIQVDIPNTLDDLWTLDIKKSSALPPAEVRKNLELIIEKIAEKSKRTWVFRGKKETDDSLVHVWNRMKSSKGGFYYEINRDHPLIDQIRSTPESAPKLIETLLRSIESSLPLNQLYIDLNNDEQIKNDQGLSEKEIIQMLRDILAVQSSLDAKKRLLEMLEVIEPYINYPNALKAIKKEYGI